VVFATGERDTSVSALFSESASCVVMDAAFRLLVVVCVYYKYKYCKWWTLGAPGRATGI
jgi:hypothetical protein